MTIRELINASGMSQRAFAEFLGIPKRSVENWCMGISKCPEYVLDLISYKLKNEGVIKVRE